MLGNGCCLLPKYLEVDQSYKVVAHQSGRKHEAPVMENQIRLKIFIACPSVSPKWRLSVKNKPKQQQQKFVFNKAFLHIFLLKNF